ncbi:MAG: hypothetical protein LDL26_06515 [Caenispirillum bisanense]|nr:hypothetical protein [Caenispirillum bisanense]MCA1974069.1 hypothetical protein [Caenispirillum sp.]
MKSKPKSPSKGDQKYKTKVMNKLQLQMAVLKEQHLKKIGYEWHDFSEPGTATVGVRPEIDKNTGLVTNVRVAGRPRPKHGGSQGQHTTAYCVTREAVISATIGRTEEQARRDVAVLFATLQKYPCYDDNVPGKIVQRVEQLSNPKSKASLQSTVGELCTLYLEIRDAIPGASLNTGVDSGVAKASAKNTHGKAEAKALGKLRLLEQKALQKGKFSAEEQEEAVLELLRLYDADSESTAQLDPEEIAPQRATFLMSAAQAFPGLFCHKLIRRDLTRALSRERPADGNVVKAYRATVDAAADDVLDTAVLLCDGNGAKDKARPQPPAFAATINDKQEIEFDGRPDSVKDGSSMGDHTASMLLMQTAATGAVTKRKQAPTNGDIAANLKAAMVLFAPEKYAFLEDPAISTSQSSPFAPYLQRLQALKDARAAVGTLVTSLEQAALAPAAPATIAEAGELYLAMVDNRPTAVNYAGVANNHNEQNVKKEIETLRKSLVLPDAQSILQALLKLVDSAAIVEGYVRYGAKGEALAEAYCRQAVDEILHFLDNAYPDLCKAIRAEVKDLGQIQAAVWKQIKLYSEEAGKNQAYVQESEGKQSAEEKKFEKRSMKREAGQLDIGKIVDHKRKRAQVNYLDTGLPNEDEEEEEDEESESEEDEMVSDDDEDDEEVEERSTKKKKVHR